MAINRESVTASAEKLVAKGKIEGAIKEYRKLVADNPNDAMTLNRLGDLYVRVNKIEEAVGFFLQIAERYTEDGFFVKAIAIFKKVIKLDPTRLPIYEKLAELYHRQGLVSEARIQYQVLVDYYFKHGKVESAENVLRKMTELDSGDPSPHVKLAELYHERGEHEKELAEYKALAEMMLRHKRVEEAMQVYQRAIASSPQDLAFITDAVLGLKDAGHPGAAAKLLAAAVQRNPQAEKIARIAGFSKSRKADGAGAEGADEYGPRIYKVSDVTGAPEDLRRAERERIAASGTWRRPDVAREEESDLDSTGAGVEEASSEVESLDSTGSGDVLHLDAEVEEELGFELEIEGVADDAPPASAGSADDWSFGPEPALELDLELPTTPEPQVEPPPEPALEAEPKPALEAEPELELEIEAADDAPAVEPKPAAPARRSRVELNVQELESVSFEVSRKAQSQEKRLGDLLAEAEVFRKYGLGEKAEDRVREILREDPQHAGALALGVQLAIDHGKPDRALGRAQELDRLSAERTSAADAWETLRPKLEKAGFGFEDGRPVAIPAPKRPKKDVVDALVDQLTSDTGAAPKRRARATPGELDVAALVDGLRRTVRPEKPAAPPPEPEIEITPETAEPAAAEAAPPEAAAPAPQETLPGFDESELADLEEEAIDDRLSWLDDAAAKAEKKSAAPSADDSLFDDEEGFFDLAAELEEELTHEEIASGREVLPREEPSLEEIVEGFKKGVAESLSPEDYDTHFNLGIAYREMGLIDEAIGEFQLAAKHENYLLDCCSLLGGCFREKGLPELAAKWYRRGLESPNLSEEGTCGLLYDLGELFAATDELDDARRTFVELYGINSNYRDVVAKLEELGAH